MMHYWGQHHQNIQGRNTEERRKVIGPLIRKGDIILGGYKKAKIYGLLSCSSGKRMKVENRVFFKDEIEALASGYRPCGHCMKNKYAEWKRERNLINAITGIAKRSYRSYVLLELADSPVFVVLIFILMASY